MWIGWGVPRWAGIWGRKGREDDVGDVLGAGNVGLVFHEI